MQENYSIFLIFFNDSLQLRNNDYRSNCFSKDNVPIETKIIDKVKRAISSESPAFL